MPRFAILEHTREGVHWDFMIEVEGVLQTWGIDAPIRPGVILPARKLPDHRLVYLDYEGPISGGRGHVTRWDGGVYRVVEWGEDRIEVELAGDQLVGLVVLRAVSSGAGASWTWILREGKVD